MVSLKSKTNHLMRKATLVITGMFLCLLTHAITKTVQSNSGSGWSVANNWSPAGVPQNGDEVFIPAGKTITVKGSIYATAANIKIYIHGTLDFDPSGKLNMGTNSVVQLVSSDSRITTNGSSSEQIIIGGGIKYNGSNDGMVTGPAFTTYAAPNSRAGNPRYAFTFGLLPVKLTSFAAQWENGKMQLKWVTVSEDGLVHMELHKSTNGKNWRTIAAIEPKNTCACATGYRLEDPSAESGDNYYRLRFMDRDGGTSFSAVVHSKVIASPRTDLVWRMNSGGDQLMIGLNPSQIRFPVQLHLVSFSGQILLQEKVLSHTIQIPVSTLPAGMVVLILEDGRGIKWVSKLIR